MMMTTCGVCGGCWLLVHWQSYTVVLIIMDCDVGHSIYRDYFVIKNILIGIIVVISIYNNNNIIIIYYYYQFLVSGESNFQ